MADSAIAALRAALADLGNATGPPEGGGPGGNVSGVDWDGLLDAADRVHALAGPVLDDLEAIRAQVGPRHG